MHDNDAHGDVMVSTPEAARQREIDRQRMAARRPAPAPPAPPANETIYRAARPPDPVRELHRPPAWPAADDRPLPQQPPRETYAQSFRRRQQMLVARLSQHPRSIRVMLLASGWVSFFMAWVVLQLSSVRLFLGAIANGRCDTEDTETREVHCPTCDWGYRDEAGRLFCRGCPCPQWPGSVVDVKLTLANFECPYPNPKFGKARGFWGRLFGRPKPRQRGNGAAQAAQT